MEQESKPIHDNEQHTPTHEASSNTSDAPSSSIYHQTTRDVRTPTTDVDLSDSDYYPESNPARPDPDSSEPSLRFPRPIGNTHLANWISTSDPDIMRITSESVNEEGGLADSTYELLTHADDTASENESQYENNDESFSESVSSLDQRRLGDTHSVSEDDEEDVPMLVQAPLPTTEPHSRPMTPGVATPTEDYDSEEDESDTNSKSSLEYTHEKLGTPSMGADETPKASTLWKLHQPDQDKEKEKRPETEHPSHVAAAVTLYKLIRDAIIDCYGHVKNDLRALKAAYQRRPPMTLRNLLSMGLAQFWVFVFGSMLIKMLCTSIGVYLPSYQGSSAVTTLTTTSAPPALVTSTSSSNPRASTTTRTDVNVREENSPLDWIFYRDIGLSYSTVDNTFVVDIPAPIKDEWLSKKCVSVTATRDKKPIDTHLETVPKGVAATLPRRERYGDVDFVFTSSCRPTTKQTVTVSFGPYENELAALARQTKDLVLRVAEERAASWTHVYERFAPPNRRDLIPACSFEKALQVVSDRFNTAKKVAQQSGHELLGDSWRLKKDTVDTFELIQRKTEVMVRDAQTNLQLGLLNSQISAKLWWLKVTGRQTERERYSQKASAYMAEKERKAKGIVSNSYRPFRWANN